MWEQIRSNKRKSVVLVILMAMILMALGFVIGFALVPFAGGQMQGDGGGGWAPNAAGGLIGLLVAFVIWGVMSLSAYYSGGKILLAASGAKKIEKKDHPQLYNVVEEMCIASGQSKLPDIYIIDDMSLNAFATGRDPDHAAIAVTAGLLGKLNRDQLQGVIAHEMSHVVNRDVLFMTMIGVMVGSIVIISEVFLHGMFYGSCHRRRGRNTSSKGGGQAQMIMMLVAVLVAVLAPILAHVIYFAASRKREYLADASAAMFTRYPEGLASALEVISRDATPLAKANKATAPMYIANPFKKVKLSALSSTHPPISERIGILRSIGSGVSYGAYQEAWKKISGGKAGALPGSSLSDGRQIEARKATVEPKKKDPRQQMREATDLLRKANDYLFLSCLCGMRMKLPPDFKHDHVKCPKCSRDVALPVAQMAAMRTVLDAAAGGTDPSSGLPSILEDALKGPASSKKKAEGPLEVTRPGSGWMSFKCACGSKISLSPAFLPDTTQCENCGKEIRINKA